ncbi:hypothetical protein [Methanobrevibacter arboriphilus]|uniref:hypothetical protein n=1 Tax=Methanobrevibacter arboriphilus TaxID=39441 RepID=UPI001CDAA004|nr:hypothetical protein [Methanobrevibacter arboriphilus]
MQIRSKLKKIHKYTPKSAKKNNNMECIFSRNDNNTRMQRKKTELQRLSESRKK